MTLVFNRIKNGEIFTSDFNPLTRNNMIEFPEHEEIAVIYGPNGTGKTSFIKVLSDVKNSELEFVYDGNTYTSGNPVFHIINDQNNRNIILGDTRDFFLGDNIRHEFELQDLLSEKRIIFINTVIGVLKEMGISAAKSPLIDLLQNEKLRKFLKDCANNKSKGEHFSNDDIVTMFSGLENEDPGTYDPNCFSFIVADYGKKTPLLSQIKSLDTESLIPNIHVREIEENTEAISILSRFHKNQCIVCDNAGIDWEKLLAAKESNRDAVKKTLSPQIQGLLEEIIQQQFANDPLNIKSRLLKTIEDGDTKILYEIINDINAYEKIYAQVLQKSLLDAYSKSEIEVTYHEYKQLIDTTPDITDEDYLYIKEIIANSMSKPLTVERDENRRLKIRLSDQDFLGKPREELPLSTGEQNFLSLTFEFLKAKNSTLPIVVIDDPISSFDSIYKNKVVYAIVKILHNKKRIVLTHNTDLIRLLDNQYRHCFKLYLLNNTDGELNGFIPLKNREEDMLISLEKLLTAFRKEVPRYVKNKELFLISMIPFMRGYASIVNKHDLFGMLTQVMHGYKSEKVDIGSAYIELFGNPDSLIPNTYKVSVSDILLKTVDGIDIVDNTMYPMLNRTLKHSFTYLFLRLAVENALVAKYGIDTDRNSQLGQIISSAYPDENDIDQIRSRIRLTSKKTLINEFNHFEGNLSIFQPAIDITDHALGRERKDILSFIDALQHEG